MHDAETLTYYTKNAVLYARRTWCLDVEEPRRRFVALLPEQARILDAGCGSGRDTLAFRRSGFDVTAYDASPSMAKEATRRSGVNVSTRRHADLDEKAAYDGIWCCASLLHIPLGAWPATLTNFRQALREEGVLYLSVKDGGGKDGEGTVRDAAGRLMVSLDAHTLGTMARMVGLTIQEFWTNSGADGQIWLNLLARRPQHPNRS